MATTGQNFILTGGTESTLSGSTVTANPYVAGLDPNSALDMINAAPPTGSGVNSTFANNSATPLDRINVDLSLTGTPGVGSNLLAFGQFIGNFAKNGCLYFTLTGTTAVTVSLQALAAAVGVASSQYGDTSLTTVYCLVFRNLSTSGTITIAPGASNPAPLPVFTGTTPTLSVDYGGTIVVYDPEGQTCSGTAKNLTFTPSAGGAFALAYGGA